jgi:hypothetical protein
VVERDVDLDVVNEEEEVVMEVEVVGVVEMDEMVAEVVIKEEVAGVNVEEETGKEVEVVSLDVVV